MPDLIHAPTEAPANTAGLLALSVTNPHGQVRRHVLAVGKNTIGSGQRCSIQLQGDGVLPLHCLISVEGGAATVTRWGPGAVLNGQEFGSAVLGAGDRLVIGGHTLSLDGPPGSDAERAAPDASSTADLFQTPTGFELGRGARAFGSGNSTAPRTAENASHTAPVAEAPRPADRAPAPPPEQTGWRSEAGSSEAVGLLQDLLPGSTQDVHSEPAKLEEELESLKAAEVEGLRSETQRLQEEAAILRRQLAEKSAEAAGSSRDLAHVETSLSETQDALAQALATAAMSAEETNRLEEEYARLREDLQETRGQIDAERTKTGELQEEIADRRADHVALAEQLRSAKAARATAEEKAASQTRALTAAKAEIVRLTEQAEEETALELRVKELETLREKLEASVKTAEAERDLLRREQTAVESHYGGLNEQIETLQSALEAKETDQERLRKKVSSLESDLRGSKEALQQATDQQDQRSVEEEQVRRAADEAREQLRLTLDALDQEGRQLAEAQEEAEKQASGLAAAQEQLVELETENRGLRDGALQSEQKLAEAAAEANRLLQRAETLSEQLDGQTNERAKQAEKLHAVERELAEARAELDAGGAADPAHAEQLTRLEETAQGLREELHSTREALEGETRERQAAAAELERLTVERERGQEQLAELEQENRALRDESFGFQEEVREAGAERDTLRNQLSQLEEELAALQASSKEQDAAPIERAAQDDRVAELERLLTARDEQITVLQAEFASSESEADTVERLNREVAELTTAAELAERKAGEAQEQLNVVQEALREREVSCAEMEDARTRLAEQVEEMTQRLQAADWALEATEARAEGAEHPEPSQDGSSEELASLAAPEEAPVNDDLPSEQRTHGESSEDSDPIDDVFAAPSEEPAEEQEPFQPESFFDQYQHLLPGENEPAAEVPAAEPQPAPKPAEPGDDDSALEQYMENLMRRVRGESSGEVMPPLAPAKREEPAPKPTEVDAAAARLSSVTPSVEEIVQEQAMSLEEWSSAARKTQPSVNLDAMRELANSSARQAIATHSRQSLLESRVYQALGFVILVGVGFYVLWSAPRIGAAVIVSAGALFTGAGWLGWRLTQCVVQNRRADLSRVLAGNSGAAAASETPGRTNVLKVDQVVAEPGEVEHAGEPA